MRNTLVAAALAALSVGALSGCSPSDASSAPPTVTITAPAPAVDEQEVVEEPETTTPKPAKAKKPAATTVAMPNVKDTNLSVTMHKLEKKGFTTITPLPVDGHAFVANPANWVVLGQDPAAGKRVNPRSEITLEVAKTEEAENSWCGDNDC